MDDNVNDSLQSNSQDQPPESGKNKNQKVKSTPRDLVKQKDDENGEGKKENTRSRIATIYVKTFFAVIFVVIVVCCLPCAQGHFKDFRDMLVTVSGILSGPLGFIIGYYFKSGEN